MAKVTIYKNEGGRVRAVDIYNAEVEYFDTYIKVTGDDGNIELVKNFNNVKVFNVK